MLSLYTMYNTQPHPYMKPNVSRQTHKRRQIQTHICTYTTKMLKFKMEAYSHQSVILLIRDMQLRCTNVSLGAWGGEREMECLLNGCFQEGEWEAIWCHFSDLDTSSSNCFVRIKSYIHRYWLLNGPVLTPSGVEVLQHHTCARNQTTIGYKSERTTDRGEKEEKNEEKYKQINKNLLEEGGERD